MRRALTLVLATCIAVPLVSLSIVATVVTGAVADTSNKRPDAGSTILKFTFRGLVAFVPQGKGKDGYDPTKPMAKGQVEKVFALVPRADEFSIDGRHAERLLDLGHSGTAHPLHVSALRVSAKHLGTQSYGDVLLPLPTLRSKDKKQSTYVITFGPSPTTGQYVTLHAMDTVAPVLKGDPDAPRYAKPTTPDHSSDLPPYSALVQLSDGDLTADHYYRTSETAKWSDGYERCTLGSKRIDCAQGTSAHFEHLHLADSVSSTRTIKGDKATLQVEEYVDGDGGHSSLYNIPLQANGDTEIEVALESGPPSEMIRGWTDEPHAVFPHFKLFYLLAAKLPDTFYFPVNLEMPRRSDPFCTPLAQFVQSPD